MARPCKSISKASFHLKDGIESPVSVVEEILNSPRDNDGPELSAYKRALNSTAIVGATDRWGRLQYVNDLFCEISEYDRDELIGSDHRILNSAHHPPSFFHQMWKVISSGNVWHGDICNRSKRGNLYWVDSTIAPLRAPDGSISGYVSIRFDVTERKNTEALLLLENRKRKEAERLLQDIVDALPNGIVAYDRDGRAIFYNNAHKELLDIAAPAIEIGAHFEDITRFALTNGQFDVPLDDAADGEGWLRSRLAEHEHPHQPYVERLTSGRWIQVHNRKSASGNLVSVQTDVTELKAAERQIKEQAERDALTGLANRRVLLDQLSSELRIDDGLPRHGALVIVDLDDFKAVNDRHGHDGGDTLLVEVSQRLKAAVRKSDTVARLGGDEFAILLYNLETEPNVARVLDKLLHGLRASVRIGHQSILASASFGVAMFPRDGKTPKSILKNADLALYQAKLKGRRSYEIYSASMRRERERRARVLDRLRKALAAREIDVALQPQCNVMTGRHSGFEALVRWPATSGSVSATEMVSIAEEAGLIGELGRQVVEKSLRIFARLKADRLQPGTIAFNVAAAQLRDPDFARHLFEQIDLHGIEPGEIELEVTENVILDRSAGDLASTLRAFRDRGVAVSLDDFGTGYASLTHLKRFPINRLKIDRSFINGIMHEKDDEIIVRTIISLAHSLGFLVVAEGVETEDQYKTLSNFGCDFIQGYLLSVPMNEIQSIDYLNKSDQNLY